MDYRDDDYLQEGDVEVYELECCRCGAKRDISPATTTRAEADAYFCDECLRADWHEEIPDVLPQEDE
jgi:hypothetical protein